MLEILLNHSRGFGGYEDETSRADLAVWERIAQTCSVSRGLSRRHGEYQINVNWDARVQYERRHRDLWSGTTSEVGARLSTFDFERVHVCPASVTFKKTPDSSYIDGSHELHIFLVDLYLMANLSTPGSFNLYRSFIRNTELDPAKDVFAQTELQLSEYVFETAWHEAKEYPWLKVGFLPFDQVSIWLESIRLSGRNVATTDLERALFSLQHLGRASFLDPIAVMWLAAALEALFDTPSGSSFSFLCKRISALLSLGEPEAAELRRCLRSFFDLRNAFIHGGGRIHHVLADDGDESVVKDVGDLLDVTNFASAVLIGSIQELVRRGWRGITFREEVLPL